MMPTGLSYPIKRFFLGITTACNMNCSYCFVKDTGEFMNYPEASKFIKFFLTSSVSDGLLYLYGGEPLLHFKLIKQIIPFFNEWAQKLGKTPNVIIVTNGTVLNNEIAGFIKRNKIKVMISLSGKGLSHDHLRTFKDSKKSTFQVIKRNLPFFFECVKRKDLWVSYTLHPGMLSNFFEDFVYLIKLGFENFHFEPVQYTVGVHWSKLELSYFTEKCQKIFDYIEGNIKSNIFLFNSKLIRDLEILLKLAPSSDFRYSLFNNLRVWPNSKIGFSHFVINLKDKYPRYKDVIGNGQFGNFRHMQDYRILQKAFLSTIKLNQQGPACFRAGERIWKIYDKMCVNMAENVIRSAQKKQIFKRYLKEALIRAV